MAAWLDHAAELIDPSGGLWTPFPKQELAETLSHRADELLFGGAAGPGKTEWGIEHAIKECVRHPNNRFGIFRRVYPSLERTIIPRAKQKLVGRAQYNGQQHTFTFPNGSILELASLQYADTVLEHQGAEYGGIFFEEITEFLQSQWEYMVGRLRAPADGIRPHAIATTNPGGRGHRWVKRRWVKPKPEDYEGERPGPGQVWRPKPSDHDPDPNTRVFVPATHEDNPALLQRDPGYVRRLRQISNRGLRLAMEKGDWDAIDAVEGALWSMEDLDGGRVGWVRRRKAGTLRRVVAVDPSDGITEAQAPGDSRRRGDAFGVSVCARGLDGVGYVEDAQEWRDNPRVMAEKTIELARDVRAHAIVMEKNHGGAWLMQVFKDVDPYGNYTTVWASENKITRAEPIAALFSHDPANEFPYRVRMVGEHEDLEEELTTYTGKPGEPSPNMLDAMVWGLTDLMLGGAVNDSARQKDSRGRGRR